MRKRTMKRLCFLLTFAAITTIIRAGVVSEQEALMKAKNFMPEKTFEQPQNANRAPMREGGQTTAPAYYIFNADENDGFVIVSADDRTNSIIGFSETGHIDESNIPTNMQAWLKSYEEAISILRSDPTIQSTPDPTINRTNIEPLLQSKWGQDSPYNLLCPTYHGKPCLTGCVATAMAQIMYYHKWPANESTAIPSYTLTDGSNSSNSLTLEELPPIIFDWDKMSTQTSDENKTAIAQLMKYCSQSVYTAYSPSASAASYENVVIALKDYFDYHKGLKFITRSNYSYNDWENIIYNELNAKRPVFYYGSNVEDGGHAWVCDGYKDGYFHMNWGWDGSDNGYFLLSLLSPQYDQSRYYSYRYQGAIIDIRPSTGTNVHIGTGFNHDGYHYVITGENSVAISNIKGEVYSGKEGLLVLPDSVRYNEKTYCVTTLGKSNGISDYEYTNLILPSTLKKIESQASFISVTTITIPDKVESIELGAFTNSKIESIVANNARFKTIDGVLFSADGKELISYPRSKKGNTYSVPNGVTHICDKAFYYNENLDSVHLPTSIENIGRFAYYNSKLKYINLNDSIYEIGSNAFSNCLLTEIDIPTNLEFLELEAFSGCPLKKIISRSAYPASASAPFDNNTYSNATLIVPIGSMDQYKYNYYWRFSNIEEQEINYDLDLEIRRMYSYEDNGITISLKQARNFTGRLVMPDYCIIDGSKKYVSEIIGFHSFDADSVILPESLEFLNRNFGNMLSLKYVYISRNISNISNTFDHSPNLRNIDIDPNNNSFCVENSILFSMDKKRLVIMPEGLGYKNYTIPEGVEDISESFWGNETIESITIPSSVKKMGAAFYNCINLRNITFADGITSIEGFYGCSSLEEITIPASVDVLASGAFQGCNNLKTIIVKQTTPCFLNDLGGNDCFDDIVYENAVLVVPLGCSNLYKTSDNWSKFKHIEERDLTDCNTNRLRTTIDGITYSCDLQKQEATIIRSENQNIPKDFTLPSSILVDGVCCKIMEIGPYAFANIAREINQLTIPEGIHTIGNSAFRNCTGLNMLQLPTSLREICDCAFWGCYSLRELVIPEGVKTIGIQAFQDCHSLEYLSLPSTLEYINTSAFARCNSLISVTIHNSHPNSIPGDVFSKLEYQREWTDKATLYVPKGTKNTYLSKNGWNRFPVIEEGEPIKTTIDGMTYICYPSKQATLTEGNKNISNITIPSYISVNGFDYMVTSIGSYAFANSESLKNINLPASIVSIKDYAFYRCHNLDTLIIPEGVISIGKSAFCDCYSLTTIVLPSTINTINDFAFNFCYFISIIIHTPEPCCITDNVFSYSSIKKATLYVPVGSAEQYIDADGWKNFKTILEGELKEVTIDGMTYTYATGSKVATLIKCKTNSTQINIPGFFSVDGVDIAVTAIGKQAFYNNNSVTKLTISEGIKNIESEAFRNRYSLKQVDLPSSLTTIEDYAFAGCTGLSSVIVRMNNPFAINESVFGIYDWSNNYTLYPSSATLYVPVGTTELYKNAVGWNKFQNILEGELKEVTIDGMTYAYATESKVATLIKGDPYLTEINIPAYLSVDGVDIAVTTIGRSAFYNNTSITKLIVSEGIKNIEASAFGCCYSLEKVDLPSSLKTIEDAAFVSCIGLSSVIVRMNNPFSINENVFGGYDWIDNNYTIHPSSATLYVPIGRTDYYKSTAGWNVFQSVLEGELKEVTIDGMTYVYVTGSKIATLIKGESNSSELNIPSSFSVDGVDIAVTTIGRSAFFNNNSITKLTVSEGIKIIEASAFGCCYSLEKVDLPSSLTTIDDCAFDRCGIIDTLIIPEGVVSIGVFSFYGCDMLRTVVLPSTIKMIDEGAFNDCKLSSVIVRINNPFEINDNVFAPISPNAVLCIPEGTASKYQETAGWNTFAIIAEPVVIKANDYIIQYGEELPDFSYTSYGVGLSGTPQITCAATTHSPVGTYPIVISKGSVTNYNDMYINGTLTITKAPLTIAALNDTIRRHEVIPEFSVVYSGFKNNEDDNVLDIKPSLSCNAASDSGLGDYEIIVSGAEAKNYDITYINGKLTIKAGIFILKYLIDNELFQTDSISYGTTIQPPMWSERVGYTFSGWSEIPTTMPAKDVEVTGSFVVNKYLLQVLIDGEEVYCDSIAFGTKLVDYVDLITGQGIDLSQWEFYDQIETVTMPAHDVVINAVPDAVLPVLTDYRESVIYDMTGRKIETEDITTLPAGIYIRNGRKFIIR